MSRRLRLRALGLESSSLFLLSFIFLGGMVSFGSGRCVWYFAKMRVSVRDTSARVWGTSCVGSSWTAVPVVYVEKERSVATESCVSLSGIKKISGASRWNPFPLLAVEALHVSLVFCFFLPDILVLRAGCPSHHRRQRDTEVVSHPQVSIVIGFRLSSHAHEIE